MAFDFPASPVIDDVYTSGEATFKWNGTMWLSSGRGWGGGGGGVSEAPVDGVSYVRKNATWTANDATTISSSDTAPSAPEEDQLWWNTANGTLYIFHNDGTSSQWVEVSEGSNVVVSSVELAERIAKLEVEISALKQLAR
jgi:hypothetical protein